MRKVVRCLLVLCAVLAVAAAVVGDWVVVAAMVLVVVGQVLNLRALQKRGRRSGIAKP